jgi:hypothetical protein
MGLKAIEQGAARKKAGKEEPFEQACKIITRRESRHERSWSAELLQIDKSLLSVP